MSNLWDWLRANNQYADALKTNDIDLDILPDVDYHDLEQLGLSLGNRRRLLKAITARDTAAAPISSGRKAFSTDIPLPAAEHPGSGDAERRQVTVMFADMVGSTALSANSIRSYLADLSGDTRMR
jgi:SAM domain (Sterile alpha motif)